MPADLAASPASVLAPMDRDGGAELLARPGTWHCRGTDWLARVMQSQEIDRVLMRELRLRPPSQGLGMSM